MDLGLGFCAFALFFLSDCNDWKWSRPGLRFCFPAGGLLLAVSTAALAGAGTPPLPGAGRYAAMAGAVGFAFLLIRTLFFSFPVEASYARPGERRPVCTGGVYALCRHPGVLWFAGLYLCLWGAAGVPLPAGLTFTALNVALVVFEDSVVFPAVLDGYGEYRRTTPFLLPNGDSVRAFAKRT